MCLRQIPGSAFNFSTGGWLAGPHEHKPRQVRADYPSRDTAPPSPNHRPAAGADNPGSQCRRLGCEPTRLRAATRPRASARCAPRTGRTVAASSGRPASARRPRRRSRTDAGSVEDALTTLSGRISPDPIRPAIRLVASSAGDSTSASQSRRTSSSATSVGRSDAFRRPVAATRLTKRSVCVFSGARARTAIDSRRGTCVDRPSRSAALRPAGPLPLDGASAFASWLAVGGAMPRRVGVPRQ